MNDWSWKIKSTVKSAYYIIKKFSRIYFGVPNIFRGLMDPLRGHTTRKNEDFWRSIHGFCLGIGLLLASISPFYLWSLFIFHISISNVFFIFRMIFSLSWSLCINNPRDSVWGVVSLGGHFACLCRGFDFYDEKKVNQLLGH